MLNEDFSVEHIKEPKLLFNKGGEALNPCVGLIKFGPRFSGHKTIKFQEFKIGIIGSAKTIIQTKQLFESFEYKIAPKIIKPWKIPFPGLHSNSPIKFSFNFNPEWVTEIKEDDIKKLEEIDKSKRSSYALELIKNKILNIEGKETPPHLIILSLPSEFFELCCDSRTEKPLIKVENDDFHNRVKLLAMELKVPTQIIRPETLNFEKTQERCLVAWNLVVGLLYKCQKGHPWKLTYLEENTCYVGISFFKEKGSQTRRASLAQIFLDTGESFVLRGESFQWINKKFPNSPHLSKENAKNITELILDHYKSVRNKLPDRLVIHKSSNFWEDELIGFEEGSKDISKKDFITILDSNIKLFTDNKYPILRGTLLLTKNPQYNFLFTTGFVPSLNTYPGFSIPRPLLIRSFTNSTDIRKIAEEILSFTKLDWNNTFVYSRYPVTISVSKKVGSVMSESIAQKMSNLDTHYFYYM